jgi:hypothetical protein
MIISVILCHSWIVPVGKKTALKLSSSKDCVKSFLSRTPRLSERFASNVKRNSAADVKKIITDYIENFRKLIEGIPPEKVFNFDERNLTYDPQQKSNCLPWCQTPTVTGFWVTQRDFSKSFFN